MRFNQIELDGAYLIDIDPHIDERGFFARTYDQNEFIKRGLRHNFVQCNISYNKFSNTFRGMHFQKSPQCEAKLVRCTSGGIFDVIIDLRKTSKTFTHWFGVELTAENRKAIYVPEGFAHGFITTMDDTEVLYQMSTFYNGEYAAGVRWNDPAFAIDWPLEIKVISERDAHYADFNDLIK